MGTTFKIQVSVIGSRVEEGDNCGSEGISISVSPSTESVKAFKSLSLPVEAQVFCNEDNGSEDENLVRFSLEEVLCHDTYDDCWCIIYDRVYDLTDFLYKHPGGDEILLDYAGRDATLAFRSVGHSKSAELALEPYLLGILQQKDRLWNHHWEIRRGST